MTWFDIERRSGPVRITDDDCVLVGRSHVLENDCRVQGYDISSGHARHKGGLDHVTEGIDFESVRDGGADVLVVDQVSGEEVHAGEGVAPVIEGAKVNEGVD